MEINGLLWFLRLFFSILYGFEILDEDMKLYDAMISIANKEIDKYGFADLLKNLSEK